MVKSSNKSDDRHVPSQSTAVFILSSMADTTWRLCVPTIGLLVLGIYVDTWFGSKPWFMFSGIVAGTVVAIFLIKKQLKRRV